MFVANDTSGNRVYADLAEKGENFFCQHCFEKVQLKRGPVRRAHFAHFKDSNCVYERNPNYKSEWHIRMQEYFPRETREVRFIDEKTGEKHIADIYIKDCETVLEFQHSPISEEEFLSRTKFHCNHGRRIVWLFDESSSAKNRPFGKFRLKSTPIPGYSVYEWIQKPRPFLSKIPLEKNGSIYSVCIFSGSENNDVFHRIIFLNEQFTEVVFAAKSVQMCEGMDVNQFFETDPLWIIMNKTRSSSVTQRTSHQSLPSYYFQRRPMKRLPNYYRSNRKKRFK